MAIADSKAGTEAESAGKQREEAQQSVVCSYNEWDPLEEVIVGRVDGGAVPPWHVTLQAATPQESWELLKLLSGKPAPDAMVQAAQRDQAEFVAILEAEGIKVRRPDPIPQTESFRSPEWEVDSAYNIANPRDGLLVIGDEIIETPMAWRSRYFEMNAYRSLLQEYFKAGARWTAAPRPRLADSLYNEEWELPEKGDQLQFAINETECCFDAADFARCGRDLFVTRSNVTNYFGIDWLRRHLGSEFSIHEIKTKSRQPMHIDTTFVPLCPGRALYSPDFYDPSDAPEVLKSWELLPAPAPVSTMVQMIDLSSAWLSMNVLMLDEKRVICEASQEPLIEKFREWGFEPIPCPYTNHYVYGGAFHCSTLDIRRRGSLQSYF